MNPFIRKYLHERAEVFRGRNVIVGCSGNFSVETTLAELGVARSIHSNDVSFYTTMLGRWLTDQPLDFRVTEEWAWLAEFTETDHDRAALVVALSGMIRYVKKTMSVHNLRFMAAYRAQFPRIHAETKEKVAKVREVLTIDGYYAGDVREHYAAHAEDPDAIFLCFAPTYKGGYENLWKPLEQIIAWEPPHYGMIDDDARAAIFDGLREKAYIWMDDRLLEGHEHEAVFAVEAGRARTQYLYTNALGTAGYVARRSKVQDPKWPMCREVRADSVVTVERVSGEVFAFYREQYLAKKIVPAPPAWCFVVKVDGGVIGAFGMQEGRWGAKDGVYMLSDFAIAPLPHPRAAKLVVYTVLSNTVREMLMRTRLHATRTLTTTAFTKAPVSMKYRGVLEIVKRGEGFLNYEGQFSDRSVQEQFQLWWRKHGRDVGHGPAAVPTHAAGTEMVQG